MGSCTRALTSIILADDDTDDMEMFCSVINDLAPELHIDTVKNGKELLERLENKTTDLVFLDINMFPVNGLEALQAIKANSGIENIPVIMFSSSGRPNDIQQSYQFGASLFLRKSETYAALRSLLKTALELDWAAPEKIRAQYLGTTLTVAEQPN